ncbi:MAG: hypothetical protein V1739_09140 [Candidatus Omnitrophota bacterium]
MKIRKFRLAKRGFASLIGLLLTLVIIAVLFYLAANTAAKRSSTETQAARKNPKSVLDKARNTVSDINKRQSENLGK